MQKLTRRGFLAGSACLAGMGATISVNAQGQRVLTATLPSMPTTLDPLNQSNHDAMAVSQLIYENLLEVDGDGNLQPQLAVALPDISEDRKTYTFRLREGVKFQNGALFTARDVKYSYDYMLDPANKALRRSYWDTIESVEIVSDFEVRFHLSRPYRPLLDAMTKYMGIFPDGSRAEHGDLFQMAPAGLGTGVAIYKASQTGALIELERNPNHWNGAADWDVVRFVIASDANARIAGLMTGETDIVGGPAARDFLRLSKQGGKVKGATKPALGASMLMMHNCGKPPFDDVNFRLAVARSIDRAAIGKQIYGGLLEETSVLVPRASKFHDAAAAGALDKDLEAAKAHLQKSAHADNPAFDLVYPTDAYLLDVRDTALFIQASLAEIGIAVKLVPLETGQMFSELFKGNHQSVLWAIVGTTDPTFIMNSLYVPGQALYVTTNYHNDELTAAINESHGLPLDQVGPSLAKAQKILAQEAPAAFIGTPMAFNLWNDRLNDFEVNNGITLRLGRVRLAA